jgi:hypothetical protein
MKLGVIVHTHASTWEVEVGGLQVDRSQSGLSIDKNSKNQCRIFQNHLYIYICKMSLHIQLKPVPDRKMEILVLGATTG